MKNYSIWKDNIKLTDFQVLDKDIETDILIIGGGITGISILYQLKNTKLNTILVDQGKIGLQTTANSIGKLTFLQNDLLDKIRNSFGDEIGKKYLESQINAINMVISIIRKEKIKCDLIKVPSILYTNNINEIEKIKDLKRFLEKCNIRVNLESTSLIESKYMIKVDDTYIFNPLKYIYGLARKLNNIYENTKIKKIIKKDKYYLCYSNKSIIKAKNVVIASHYPYFNLPFIFPIKATLEKSYLSASKYLGNDISLISYSNPFISIRTYLDYLIYLSNSHSINKDCDDKNNFNELIKKINDLNLRPNYLWSNIDIITNDGLPYIGKIDNNMFIATGYNTWGLATSTLASTIIKDLVLNKDNQYVSLFDPKRENLWKIMGGFGAIYKSLSGYISGFTKNKDKKKCTHMGCPLIYNEIENTWDCPCHGSRFDVDGKVIMSPANKDIK